MESYDIFRRSVQQQNVRDVLTTWGIPRDLFEPLYRYARNNINDLEILLELYSDKDWDWKYLSTNPNITCEIICDNRDKPWDWEGLSYNKFQRGLRY